MTHLTRKEESELRTILNKDPVTKWEIRRAINLWVKHNKAKQIKVEDKIENMIQAFNYIKENYG